MKTNFGFSIVDKSEKDKLVQNVFQTVAPKYDLMNDLMSFGLHHLWKDKVINEIRPTSRDILLDVAGGTGDIARKFIERDGGHAVIYDLNQDMLAMGKQRIFDDNFKIAQNLEWIHGNAENLIFEDDLFDYYTISFGIRNVTNIDVVLKEAHRVLKYGGKFICLELCHTQTGFIKQLYDFYSFKIIPTIGKVFANSYESYEYLIQSIRKFPKPEAFAQMIENAGFKKVKFQTLSFGVVAIHCAYKI